jgi:hypothetical protein
MIPLGIKHATFQLVAQCLNQPRHRVPSIYIYTYIYCKFSIFSSLVLDVYVQLNMFRASSRPSSEAQQLQYQSLVLPLERGDSSAEGPCQAGRPDHDQQHCYHHAPTVKPETGTAVVELLMMGVRTPETCWAVHNRQIINLGNCLIWLVDLFELYDDARTCKL